MLHGEPKRAGGRALPAVAGRITLAVTVSFLENALLTLIFVNALLVRALKPNRKRA